MTKGTNGKGMVDVDSIHKFFKGNHELISEVMGLLAHKIPVCSEAMLKAYLAEDWKMLGTNAHAMISQTNFLKLPEIGAELRKIEFLAEQGKKSRQLSEMILRVVSTLEVVTQELRRKKVA